MAYNIKARFRVHNSYLLNPMRYVCFHELTTIFRNIAQQHKINIGFEPLCVEKRTLSSEILKYTLLSSHRLGTQSIPPYTDESSPERSRFLQTT